MIRCDEVTKVFRKNGSEVTSLDRFTAEVAEGEFVAVRGPSGSGKTTLLLTLGGMQRPSDGSVQLAGRDLYAFLPAERAGLRSSDHAETREVGSRSASRSRSRVSCLLASGGSGQTHVLHPDSVHSEAPD